MAENKKELLENLSLTNQEGIVNLLAPQPKLKVKRLIPGGANMLTSLDQENLERACFNWIRGASTFEEVTISLAKDPEKFRLAESKVVSFPENKTFVWENKEQGKRYLARELATLMKKNKFVVIKAKKDGIYLYTDAEKKFSPTRKATQADVDASAGKVEHGSMIRSENWEPYIEFIKTQKSRYAQ